MDTHDPPLEPTVVDAVPKPGARPTPPSRPATTSSADRITQSALAARVPDASARRDSSSRDTIDQFLSRTPPPAAATNSPAGGPTAQPSGPEPTAVLSIRQPSAEHEQFIVAAEPIFVLVTQLKTVRADADLSSLRHRTAQEIGRFEESATRFGARPEDVTAARYVLCALVDETVLTTPWGSRSSWSSNSLLSELHGETWGGEKVFQILDRVIANPARYIALLRLIDLALMLGFEGRYRVIDNGRYQLEDRRTEIGRVLKTTLPSAPDELSGSWQGVVATDRLRRYVPLWVVVVGAAAALVVLYTVLQISLGQSVDPLDKRLDAIVKMQG